MCVIIYDTNVTKMPSLNFFQDAFEANPDGVAACFHDGKRWFSMRSMDFNDFKKFYGEHKNADKYIFHTRIASRGQVSMENVHGWKCGKVKFFTHNGTITPLGNSKISDSYTFLSMISDCSTQERYKVTDLVASLTHSKFAWLEGGTIRSAGTFFKCVEGGPTCFASNLYFCTNRWISKSKSKSYTNYWGYNYKSASSLDSDEDIDELYEDWKADQKFNHGFAPIYNTDKKGQLTLFKAKEDK